MARVPSLTRAFLASHPAEAPRVRGYVDPESCAALLNALPIKQRISEARVKVPMDRTPHG